MKFYQKNISKIIIVIAFSIIYILLLNHFLPINQLFNEKPIVTDDHPYRLYQAMQSKEAIMHFRLYSYDTKMGLYNSIIDESSKLFTVIAVLLFFIPIIPLFKVFIFLSLLSMPFIILQAGRNFGIKKQTAIILFLMSIVVFYFERNSLAMLQAGLESTVFSFCISILAISYLYKNITTLKAKQIITFALMTFVAFLAHPLSLVTTLFFVIILSIFYWKEMVNLYKKTSPLLKVGIFVVCLGFLLYLMRYMSIYNSVMHISVLKNDAGSGISRLWNDIKQNSILAVLYFLGFTTLFIPTQSKEKSNLKKIFITYIISLFILGYFGADIPFITHIKPFRFVYFLNMMLLLSIHIFMIDNVVSNTKVKRKNKTEQKMKTIRFAIIFILIVSTFYTISDIKMIKENWNRRTIQIGIPKDTSKILEWIQENIPKDERILIEGSATKEINFDQNTYDWKNWHMYGGHISSLFAYYTNNSYMAICDMIHEDVKNLNETICFRNGYFDGIKLNDNSFQNFSNRLTRFNISWIVAWSQSTKETLASSTQISSVKKIDAFEIFHTSNEIGSQQVSEKK